MSDESPTPPQSSKIAIIGVGLIGGSVGLAARARVDGVGEVAGWDPAPGVLDEALQLGVITSAADSPEAASEGADLIVLASPVATLVENAERALAVAGPDAVVTDVGSTKGEIVAAVDDPRFIGGHPIAGAETAGVEHAREDLFDDSTWFVTPTPTTTGTGLERLLRFARNLGAQPHAIDAGDHDRLLADISHLPHVFANALVTQAAGSINTGDGSVSVVGPSFRDATRVAGANSSIWRDIYLSNHLALVPAIDSVIGRLSEFRDAIKSGDGDEIVRLNEQARADRETLLERDLVGEEVFELRVSVPNQPGVLANITLALGKAGVNIVDMALSPAVDGRTGAISLWVPGEDAAQRTEDLMRAKFDPSGPLKGSIRPPADKSISHRAAMVAGMCDSPVTIRNYLNSEDTNSTLAAVEAVGAGIERRGEEIVVRGVGLRGAQESAGGVIDVGNAGTLMRLLPGWLAGQPTGDWELDGDASIRKRPMRRIVDPLRQMGAHVDASPDGTAPICIEAAPLKGIDYVMPVASGQVKSCVLFAGLVASGATRITEPEVSRDHTERMLAAAGVPIRRENDSIVIDGLVDELELGTIDVPGDLSSAAFMIVAGVLIKGSRLVVKDVGLNRTRIGILRILERMGAVVLADPEEQGTEIPGHEPVGDLDIAATTLVGTEVSGDEVPLAIDELPLVALLGAFAEGETIVRGAEELRFKESDRIATVVDGLSGLGADIEATDDGFVVRGTGKLRGGTIASHGDHRLAMLGAIAGLASEEGVTVDGMEAASVSYPTFESDLKRLIG